jgi:hypothetical protein
MILSVGYQVYEQIPETSYVARDLEILRLLGDLVIFGPSGVRLHFVLGVVMFGLVGFLTLPARTADG